ncbi:MAG: hemerythrin domain-containing protein [Chloroflexi bacterium]|nr:hemerythrin domain-containing protein [Chloroflexota bacterium]
MLNGKRPTEILKQEHKDVLQRLDSLEKVLDHLDRKEEIAAELKGLASFFNVDFWVHFAKEEDALFPEIEKFIPRNSGPTGIMLSEHEDLRGINAELQPAIQTYLVDSGGPEAKRTIQGRGHHFIEVLRDHINKEDNILFRIADMHLDQAQIERVVVLFDKIEKGR